MNSNLENGDSIMGILRGLIRKEMASRASQQARNDAFEEEKDKDDKQSAAKVQDALANRTTNDPSREVIPNVTFSTNGLASHKEVGALVLNVIRIRDRNVFHDPKWLENKLSEFHKHNDTFEYGSNDYYAIQHIEDSIARMLRKLGKNDRVVDIERREEEINGKPSARKNEYQQLINKMNNLTGKTWDEAVDDLARARGSKATERMKQVVSLIKSNEDPKIKQHADLELARCFDDERKEIRAKMEEAGKILRVSDADNAAALYKDRMQKLADQSEDLDLVYQKIARNIRDTNPEVVEKGRLYDQMRDPVLGRAIEQRILDDPDYMDYWFYHIIEPVLHNPQLEQHKELFTLYPAADMDLFLEIVRKKIGPDGKNLGLNLAAKYTVLKNTIFQSHDMDYFCSHPMQEMKDFISSTSLFLNSYIDTALQDPLVCLAKRIYERELLRIRESHGGWVPREYLSRFEFGKMRAGKLDQMVEVALKEEIKARQLCRVKIDKATGLPYTTNWGKQLLDKNDRYTWEEFAGEKPGGSEDWGGPLSTYKIQAALKQAKGVSLVDQRLLEIIARSKGTGSTAVIDKVRGTVQMFNSVPYENIVRHLEPVVHYYTRFAMGHEYYDAFFNMTIADTPKMTSNHMKQIIKLDMAGRYPEMEEYCKENGLGDISTRLNHTDNPFGYSSMWGTMTKWRNTDATHSFDDWEIDHALGSAVKLTMIGDRFYEKQNSFQVGDKAWAQKKVRKYYTEGDKDSSDLEVREAYQTYQSYRTEFRDRVKRTGTSEERDMAARDEAAHGMDDDFELYWKKVGIKEKKEGSIKTYQNLIDEKWDDDMHSNNRHCDEHGNPKGEALKLIKQLERAYKARVWIQTTMRSPLIVARELEVEWERLGNKTKTPLRNKILREIFEIEIKELKDQGTPEEYEEVLIDEISEIERALGSVSETAIRENRDLTAKDFDDIIGNLKNDPLQINYIHAKRYWEEVLKATLPDHKTVEQVYEALGVQDAINNRARGLRYHQIDWKKIKDIKLDGKRNPNQFIIDGFKGKILNNAVIDRDWRYLFSTEDMGWEYLNIGALGERNPVRRAGDLGDHVAFGQELELYLSSLIVGTPDLDKLTESLKKMSMALSGDYYDVAVEACGRIIYTTGMMYRKADVAWRWGPASLVWNLFNDASIVETIRTRQRGQAMGPNELMQFAHKVVGASIIPSSRYSRMGGRELAPMSEWNGSVLEKRWGSSRLNAVWEIGAWAPFWAFILQILRAFQTPSEEEEK